MGFLIRPINMRWPAWRGALLTADRAGDAGPVGNWQCDLADSSLRWSPEIFDLFGLPRGTALDRRAVVEMYVDESRELMERLRAQAITDRGSFTIEAQIRRPSGELRWMRLSADVLCRGGRAELLYGSKQDITAEMLAR